MSIIHASILTYFLIINAAAFLSMHIDKRRAKKHCWRIPEKTLLLLAALGGSTGALAGMYTAHHKTRKPKFYLGVPAIWAMQAGFAVWLLLMR